MPQALMLLEDLQQHWLSPDVITCNTCISACQAQPWWLAIQLGLSPSPICVTPSLVTYNATISSCRDTWVEALALFASLLRSRTSPDVVTSNAAISACCTYWQRAFLLFHELRIAEQMQRDIMTDIITYGAVIKASENAALWQSAVSSLGELNIQSMQIDVIACNSSISACEKAAQWQQSICLLTEQYLRGTLLMFGNLFVDFQSSGFCSKDYNDYIYLVISSSFFFGHFSFFSWQNSGFLCFGQASDLMLAATTLSSAHVKKQPHGNQLCCSLRPCRLGICWANRNLDLRTWVSFRAGTLVKQFLCSRSTP